MSIDRDDCDERQIRLDWMIDEFRTAQTRRLTKANDKSVELQKESDRKATVTAIDAMMADAESSFETRNLPRKDHNSR